MLLAIKAYRLFNNNNCTKITVPKKIIEKQIKKTLQKNLQLIKKVL